ncbi:MAG: hypothetical protein K9K30_00865 [Burkholderiaceae bacterium]|nr:hypothetical protein [Sulfuritalea sp.]MCF8173779.1 hypothetical protein [Burkholderiaceae bacterium]MCF8184934.1 hypothetical protein [Polynucleobacter sp.]
MKKTKLSKAVATNTIAPTQKVSQNCDELNWTFKVYVSETGSQALQKSIDAKDEVVIQYFKTRIRYLANTPKRDWKQPHAKKLKGVRDIYEIRFAASGVQHRPLGFFGPGEKEFTIVLWATHKQDIYDPHNAINTADGRRKLVSNRDADCLPLKINGEKFPCAEKP